MDEVAVLPEVTPKKPLLSDQQYLWLKNLAMVLLPGTGSLYFGLAQIWSWPGGEQFVGTCALLATFLGIFVKLGERSYDKSDAVNNVGTIHVIPHEDGTTYQLDIGENDPALIEKSGKVVFDVDTVSVGGGGQ